MYLRGLLFRLSLAAVLVLGAARTGMIGPAVAQPRGDDAMRLTPMPLQEDDPSYLDLGAGVYDIIGNAHRNETIALDLEFRYGRKLFHVGPALGVIADARGGGMVYVGFYGDIPLGPIIVTPLAGLGVWRRGDRDDEDLGGWFEYRLSLEASYQFANRSRLGLRIGHISNADLHRRNPGENDLMLTYGLPVGF
jgi:lipid A 3-O-deacylase